MNEQPQIPEIPEEDLFDWAEKHKKSQPKVKPEKDDLGWDCPQCELNSGWCPRHPRSESVNNQEEDSSIRIAEHESEIQEARRHLKEPATKEELDAFFEEMRKKLAS